MSVLNSNRSKSPLGSWIYWKFGYLCLTLTEAKGLSDLGYNGYLDICAYLLLKQKPFWILDIMDIWMYTCLPLIEAEALLDLGSSGYLDIYILGLCPRIGY